MFPGAGAQVYHNETGEPLGWDYPSDEPYERERAEARAMCEYDNWISEQIEAGTCCQLGDWNSTGGWPATGWRCAHCWEPIPLTVHQGRGLMHPLSRFNQNDPIDWPMRQAPRWARSYNNEDAFDHDLREAGLL